MNYLKESILMKFIQRALMFYDEIISLIKAYAR